VCLSLVSRRGWFISSLFELSMMSDLVRGSTCKLIAGRTHTTIGLQIVGLKVFRFPALQLFKGSIKEMDT
jgi:hypothetical protein